MASGPITSWQIEREEVEAVTDFVFLGSKITADGNCSHKHLLLERKVMTNLDSILKSRDLTLPTKKGNAKECSNYHTITLILHASKVMLEILQARLQQYANRELPDVQAGFRKGRGTRDQTANIHWIMEKAREFQKNIYFCFIDMPKPLTVWITINCGKILKEMGIPDHLTYLLRNLYAGQEAIVRTGHGTTDWF